MLACLYDVHGNLAALDAVLADARAAYEAVLGSTRDRVILVPDGRA